MNTSHYQRWLQHNLNLLGISVDELNSGNVEFTLLDREALHGLRLYSRDSVRPTTQRELRCADAYDPLQATQAVIIVKFPGPKGPEHHVINGNNRIFLFGCPSTNPKSLALPVITFKTPDGFERILGADPWCGFNRARRFNFN